MSWKGAMLMTGNDVNKAKLIDYIRAAANDVSKNAASIVGDMDYLKEIEIRMSFDPYGEPSVSIDHTYLPSGIIKVMEGIEE